MATKNLNMENYFSTTLSQALASDGTTVYLNAVPTAAEGYLVIEPETANKEIIYYTSKGANYVTCPSAAAGRGVGGTSARAHDSGAAVKMNNVAEYWKALKDGTGFADGAIATAKIAGGAVNNAKLDTTAGEPGGVWKAWTPIWTGLPVSNSTVSAKYTQVGKTIIFRALVTLAGGDKPNGAVIDFTLPVNQSTEYPTLTPIGDVSLIRSTYYRGLCLVVDTGKARIGAQNAAGTYIQWADVTATVPATWTNGDKILVSGAYEAA